MRPGSRATILCGLILAQLVTVLALVLVSGRITGAAESEHNDALLGAASAEAADRVRAHVEPVSSIVAITSALAAEPVIDADEFRRISLAAMAEAPQIAGVFVGTPDGGFVDVRRDGEQIRVKTILIDNTANDDTRRSTTLEFYDLSGQLVNAEADPTDTYDPTARPWYQLAVADPGEVLWTEPYVFFSSGEPGITAAKTVTRDGQVAGVVAADIELGSLSTFLGTLDINDAGGTVVVDDAGRVIAHPNPDLVQIEDGDGVRPVSISELDDPFARAAIGSLVGEGGNSGEINEFEADGIGDARASFRSVPVAGDGWTVGVFAPEGDLVPDLASARSQERWLTITVGILSVLVAGLVALSVTRPITELETRANTDSLTGLPNRRIALEHAEDALRSEGRTGAAILDLDFFKAVNDNHGHLVGDEVLIGVTRRIESAMREGEAFLSRIGGEEFMIVFSDTNDRDAEMVCDRIIERIRSKPFATSVGLIKMTTSIGLAVPPVRPRLTVSELMALADSCLLEAKDRGRDRLVIHGHDDAARSDAGEHDEAEGRFEPLTEVAAPIIESSPASETPLSPR